MSPNNICFVIMPFKYPFSEYYKDIIKPAIENANLTPQRADEILGPGCFMQNIVDGIRNSKVIIAELTGRNPNVFYELGLSHGWDKPVILLTQNKKDVPSDLKSIKWIYYRTILANWSEELKKSITLALLNWDKNMLKFPFLIPNNSETTNNDFSKKLCDISGTQKQILDFIKECADPIGQRAIEKRFSLFPSAELFTA